MQENLIIRRRRELLEAEVDGELVGLQIEQGKCYGFNPTASQVWRLLDEPKSFAALRDSLLDVFEVDRDTCERELAGLLRTLERSELVSLSADD